MGILVDHNLWFVPYSQETGATAVMLIGTSKSDCYLMEQVKPYLVVCIVKLIYAGMYIFTKLASTNDVNSFVFVFYRMAFASFFLAPCAIHERKKAPPLSFGILVNNFMLAFFGITLGQDLFYVGLKYTSSVVASAITNSLPVATFFLAVLLGMENFKPKSLPGAAKLASIALCLAGVVTITFYSGPMLQPLHSVYSSEIGYMYHEDKSQWIEGTILMVIANVSRSLYLVVQGKLLMHYPSKILLITLQCLFGMVQSLIIALTFERDLLKWKLGFGMDLLAVTYCGIVVNGIGYYLQAWVIEKKGPVFMAAFSPLVMVFTILFSVFLLKEAISLGSIIGGVLLIGCLYAMLWGKSKEETSLYLPIIDNDGGEGLEESAGTSQSRLNSHGL